MTNDNPPFLHGKGPIWILFPLLAAISVCGQKRIVLGQESRALQGTAPRDYVIGPGDVVAIHVVDGPELTGRFRVSNDGYLALPLLASAVKAQGLTPQQLSQSIAKALEEAQLFQQPAVTTFVDDYRSQTVTVLGAVQKPSVYALEKPTTLVEALSMAGGLLPSAGSRVTITRQAEPRNRAPRAQKPHEASALTIDLAKLLRGRDPALNVFVHAGDVIAVSSAPVVYVVGAVRKPGGFAMQDPGAGLTVLQALGVAEGLAQNAAPNRSIIVRGNPDTEQRQQLPINVAKLLQGKTPDVRLEAGDILFIPESSMKKSVRAMAQTAQSAIVGIATYGIGLGLAY